MAFPRAYHVETLLPDGTVLVTGGGRTTGDYDVANAVFHATGKRIRDLPITLDKLI